MSTMMRMLWDVETPVTQDVFMRNPGYGITVYQTYFPYLIWLQWKSWRRGEDRPMLPWRGQKLIDLGYPCKPETFRTWPWKLPYNHVPESFERPPPPKDGVFPDLLQAHQWQKWLEREVRAYFGEVFLLREELRNCHSKAGERAYDWEVCRHIYVQFRKVGNGQWMNYKAREAMVTGNPIVPDPLYPRNEQLGKDFLEAEFSGKPNAMNKAWWVHRDVRRLAREGSFNQERPSSIPRAQW
eukprot:TRINITY_DN67923_c4_g1_i1.p2 TRINITY_DN67923_c4_g1~~TRINITY_DN67923_c4_g1_i1.p2  ORF type:complete len:240 (-),score=7.67 TRINITY_DN67923_c4_g1_i1:200-919(-)